MLTRDEVLEVLCGLQGLVYYAIGKYTHASDGVCHRCVTLQGPDWTFHHGGQTLTYMRNAVVGQLQRDGYPPSKDLLREINQVLQKKRKE